MNRVLLGALGGLLLVAAGTFWWQARLASEVAKSPQLALATAMPEEPPSSDASGAPGPDLPEATEVTKEHRRFDHLDRDHDNRITRNEMLTPRVAMFKKLDTNHDNLLTFEEWAGKTVDKFAGADANHDGWLSRAEFATTRAKVKAKPACSCEKTKKGRKAAEQPTAGDDGSGDGEGEPST
jgi:hypothetical protein